MMSPILINGIDSLLGARIAQALSTRDDVRLIGLGARTPIAPVGRAEILTAILNGQQMVELLRAEQIGMVVHLDFAAEEQPARSRESAVQQNVLRSMELLGACATAGVKRVVLRSSTFVYGPAVSHPAFIREDQPVAQSGPPGLIRDYMEVDTFAGDFARKHPELQMVVLRCAGLVGGGVSSPLVRYLAQPNPRVLLGFDPRIQVLHIDDAVAAFVLAMTSTVTGVFNLAAAEPIKLVRAIRLTGRQPVAVFEPLLDAAAMVGRGHGWLGNWPFGRDFLRYSCVADMRRAQDELGWRPEHTAEAALRELDNGRQASDDRAEAEAALRAFLSRRSES